MSFYAGFFLKKLRFPNRKTVESLLYKRGYGKVGGQRLRLSSNFIVEENLAKCGMTCMEDIVNEILTCGPEFKKVNNFLWYFYCLLKP